MKLIDRYIAKSVLSAIALVTLMLAGLQIFILFVNQLGDLGKKEYGLFQAIIFVFLQMPYQLYLFFPMASLLGSLIGLGVLANHRELIVMRAAGVSIGRITLGVLKAALLVICIVSIAGEMVIPQFARIANDKKIQALSGGQALRTGKGVWLRRKNDFIFIGAVLSNNILQNILQFHFNEVYQLRFIRQINELNYVDEHWEGKGIAETWISEQGTMAKKIASMPWDVSLKPKVLHISTREPDEMTLRELNTYLNAQKENYQNVISYQLTYWQRIIQPVTTVVMMLLAIPFIFGPLRSSTIGSKLIAGSIAGFGFYILNRFLGPISQVLQWPIIFAAIGPTILFAFIGLYLMKRVK